MKWFRCCGFVLLAQGALLVSACSGPSTSIKQANRIGNIANAPYSNVLVIAVAKSQGNARRFENALAERLNSAATNASPNHILLDTAELDAQQVRSVVNEMKADAVIVTSVKRADIGRAVEESRTETARNRKSQSLIDFFSYEYKDVTTAPIVKLNYEVELKTDVYDALSGEKVYSIVSSTEDAETSFDVIVGETKAIAKQLRKAGLVR